VLAASETVGVEDAVDQRLKWQSVQ